MRWALMAAAMLSLSVSASAGYYTDSAISAAEIEDKAYRAVRLLKGDISPEEYSLYEFQKGGGFDVKKRRLQEQP